MYRDFDKIVNQAMIYSIANDRPDIANNCKTLRDKIGNHKMDEEITLNDEESYNFGSMCPYAAASVNSADLTSKQQVCDIIKEHSNMINQYDQSSIMMVAMLQIDRKLGKKCPFYKLYKYLKILCE